MRKSYLCKWKKIGKREKERKTEKKEKVEKGEYRLTDNHSIYI